MLISTINVYVYKFLVYQIVYYMLWHMEGIGEGCGVGEPKVKTLEANLQILRLPNLKNM